jgi:hypothetical protein
MKIVDITDEMLSRIPKKHHPAIACIDFKCKDEEMQHLYMIQLNKGYEVKSTGEDGFWSDSIWKMLKILSVNVGPVTQE